MLNVHTNHIADCNSSGEYAVVQSTICSIALFEIGKSTRGIL